MSDTRKTYPRYFVLDDIYIRIELEGDEVAGYNHFGVPYPPRKALVEGQEIGREEYQKGVKSYCGRLG